MGLDENIVSIVQELVRFLESLGNVELPTAINALRESLLSRSKIALCELSAQESLSAEPYLVMKKGLSFVEKTTEIEEYVDAENPQSPVSKNYYYESFAEVKEEPKSLVTSDTSNNSAMENLLSIYKSFSVEQTRGKCHKCGPLERKEGKKFFLLEQYRSCWVGLLGTHLLIYGSEYDIRPLAVLSMRDYKVRPASNKLQRDPRRSEAAFEIFSSGNKTMLFIARTPKDMEQWVAAISRVGCSENDLRQKDITNFMSTVDKAESDVVANESISTENYQDVSIRGSTAEQSPQNSVIIDQNMDTKKENNRLDSPAKATSKNDDTPPSLPERIYRNRPCIATNFKVHSDDTMEDMDYGIYHKIEDIKGHENVNNLMKKIPNIEEDDDRPLYDDLYTVTEEVRALKKLEVKEMTISVQKAVKDLETQDTYDDAFSIRLESNDQNKNSQKQNPTKLSSDASRQKLPDVPSQRESSCYDDAQGVTVQVKSKKEMQKTKEEGHGLLERTPQKKSFLDRVRNRRDSPKKEEKKNKRSLPPTPITDENLPTYDDIANATASINLNIKPRSINSIQIEEPSEYNFPPPPKPIYDAPAVANPKPEAKIQYNMGIIDSQENGMDQSNDEIVQRDLKNQNVIPKYNKVPVLIIDKEEFMNSEHYQTPKNNPVTPAIQDEEVEEDLYDDVAIVAEKARLRGLAIKEEEAGDKKINILSSPEKSTLEKKPWNSVTANRKNKVTEDSSLETNNKPNDQITTPEEMYDDNLSLSNKTYGVRKNIQKLFNKFA